MKQRLACRLRCAVVSVQQRADEGRHEAKRRAREGDGERLVGHRLRCYKYVSALDESKKHRRLECECGMVDKVVCRAAVEVRPTSVTNQSRLSSSS